MRKLIVLLVALAPIVALSEDQSPAFREATAATLTRSATKYRELEYKLLQALQDRDNKVVNKILSDDFEESSAEKSGATTREEWQRAWFAKKLQSFGIREIAVREYGEVAVVSFLQSQQIESAGKISGTTVFVIDVWNPSIDTLKVRYISTPAKPVLNQTRKE